MSPVRWAPAILAFMVLVLTTISSAATESEQPVVAELTVNAITTPDTNPFGGTLAGFLYPRNATERNSNLDIPTKNDIPDIRFTGTADHLRLHTISHQSNPYIYSVPPINAPAAIGASTTPYNATYSGVTVQSSEIRHYFNFMVFPLADHPSPQLKAHAAGSASLAANPEKVEPRHMLENGNYAPNIMDPRGPGLSMQNYATSTIAIEGDFVFAVYDWDAEITLEDGSSIDAWSGERASNGIQSPTTSAYLVAQDYEARELYYEVRGGRLLVEGLEGQGIHFTMDTINFSLQDVPLVLHDVHGEISAVDGTQSLSAAQVAIRHAEVQGRTLDGNGIDLTVRGTQTQLQADGNIIPLSTAPPTAMANKSWTAWGIPLLIGAVTVAAGTPVAVTQTRRSIQTHRRRRSDMIECMFEAGRFRDVVAATHDLREGPNGVTWVLRLQALARLGQREHAHALLDARTATHPRWAMDQKDTVSFLHGYIDAATGYHDSAIRFITPLLAHPQYRWEVQSDPIFAPLRRNRELAKKLGIKGSGAA